MQLQRPKKKHIAIYTDEQLACMVIPEPHGTVKSIRIVKSWFVKNENKIRKKHMTIDEENTFNTLPLRI